MDKWMEKYAKAKNITSKYTLRSMVSNLRRLEKTMDIPFDKWKVSDFKNSEKIVDGLVDKYQLNSVLVSISAAKVWLMSKDAPEDIIDDYHEIMKDLSKTKDETVKEQKKTPTEEELGEDFEYPKMKAKIEKYIKENINKATNHQLRNLMLVGLYSLQPPTRIGNYLDMQVRSGTGKGLPKDKNYLLVNDGKFTFVFNKYKTSNSIGQVVLPVEDELLEELLEKYVETLKGKKPIFIDRYQGSITAYLKTITKKIFGVPFSVNTFRHSFLTHFMEGNPSIKDKEKIAKIVGQIYKPSRAELYSRVS